MGRPSLSQRQPDHRRPAWARDKKTYETYITNATGNRRSTGIDFGLDNFSYDEAQLAKWQVPAGLLNKHLPQELQDAATDWIFAGAAVCTALERIDKLDDEAIHRLHPKTTHQHLFSRRTSDQAPTVVGAETPPVDSPVLSSPLSLPTSVVPFDKNPLIHPIPQLSHNNLGMPTPPFSPVGTQGSNTPLPVTAINPPNGTVPDLHQVSAQLSPSATQYPLTSASSGTATPNAETWAVFVDNYEAEMKDIQKHSFMRFKGYARKIDAQLYELHHEDSMSEETMVAAETFETWWKTMRPKVSEYEEKVRLLRLPKMHIVIGEWNAQQEASAGGRLVK